MAPSITVRAGATSTLGDVGRGAQFQMASALLLLVQRGRSSSGKARGVSVWGGGEANGLQIKGMPMARCRAGGFTSARRVGPWRRRVCAWWPVWSMSWRAVHRLLSAFLTRLSCPSVCLRPLCSGAALPAPGGSVGSVNGYHTCKGELAVTAVPARACRGRLAVSLSVFVCAFPSVRI